MNITVFCHGDMHGPDVRVDELAVLRFAHLSARALQGSVQNFVYIEFVFLEFLPHYFQDSLGFEVRSVR